MTHGATTWLIKEHDLSARHFHLFLQLLLQLQLQPALHGGSDASRTGGQRQSHWHTMDASCSALAETQLPKQEGGWDPDIGEHRWLTFVNITVPQRVGVLKMGDPEVLVY